MRPHGLHSHAPDDRSTATIVDRSNGLPADVITLREAEWLNELKARLVAVQVWRGLAAPHHFAPAPLSRSRTNHLAA